MSKSNTKPARGMRDFLPDQVRKRNYVIGIIKEVYEKYGFEPLETPTIENLSTLTNKYGEEGDQLMFKILKRGEKLKKQLRRDDDVKENDLTDLALRYDLTVPLARVVANYKNDLPKFFKRYQIQPVWRADRPARGRYREFYQCDVDAIGSKSMVVEAELISAVSEILEKLGFDDFAVRVNHRRLLTSVLRQFQIPKEKHSDTLNILDKQEKAGELATTNALDELGVLEPITTFYGLSIHVRKRHADTFLQIYTNENSRTEAVAAANEAAISALEGISESGVGKIKGLSDLKLLLEFASLKPSVERKIWIDPSLIRGLSYYTGVIFEVVLTKGDFSGSIAGGGRYDGLIGMFGKEEIPAVGLSLGLERILLIMEERGMFPDDLATNAADVLVTIWKKENRRRILKTRERTSSNWFTHNRLSSSRQTRQTIQIRKSD